MALKKAKQSFVSNLYNFRSVIKCKTFPLHILLLRWIKYVLSFHLFSDLQAIL